VGESVGVAIEAPCRFLFQKLLTATDVGLSRGRILLPRLAVEEHFPDVPENGKGLKCVTPMGSPNPNVIGKLKLV
jgi:hypothetical protein